MKEKKGRIMAVRVLLALFIASLPAGGCLGERQAFLHLGHDRLETGAAVLVLPVWSDEANRAVAERMARLLAQELGARWGNVKSHDWLRETGAWTVTGDGQTGGARLQSLVASLQSPPSGEGLAVGTVVVVEVSLYEQYWERLTKITRVGLEARLIHPSTGHPLWGGRYDVQVKGHPGRAFDDATRLAISGLAEALDREARGWLQGRVPSGRR